MSIKHNPQFANANLVTGSVKSLMDDGFLYLFDGPIPATANEAINGGSQLVAKISVDDDGTTGLTFNATPSNGVIFKTAAEAWEGEAVATTTMTFFRFCGDPTDDGEGVGTSGQYRWQGTIGPDGTFDWIRPNPAVTIGDPIEVDIFQYVIPLE